MLHSWLVVGVLGVVILALIGFGISIYRHPFDE